MAAPKQAVDDLRSQMRDVDARLVECLVERFQLSKKIHSAHEEGASPADGSERELLERIVALADGRVPLGALKAIFHDIAGAAREVERPTRAVYVGPEGNFCHRMSMEYFGPSATLIEALTVQEALDEVKRGRAAYAVFAFDSSVDGLILPAISALAQTDLMLVAERTVAAEFVLMSATGNPADIDKVYSTVVGHAACELFLGASFPKASALDVRSMVEAATLAQSDHGAAAIVPRETGAAQGLVSVRDAVGDEPELRYRFGVAGIRPASRTGADTTCVLFSLDDEPGTLFRVLSHFAERGINLKKIQSRPVRGASWDYVFYVEVTGHATDRAVVTALEAIKGSTRYLKLLGSFPTES
jgi:chorismate mutase / prephenate dehydratase